MCDTFSKPSAKDYKVCDNFSHPVYTATNGSAAGHRYSLSMFKPSLVEDRPIVSQVISTASLDPNTCFKRYMHATARQKGDVKVVVSRPLKIHLHHHTWSPPPLRCQVFLKCKAVPRAAAAYVSHTQAAGRCAH